MAKTTLVQQLSVQKSENLKAVELFLTTRALFHTLKSSGRTQAVSGDPQIQTNERENK